MKIFIVSKSQTELADESPFLLGIRDAMLDYDFVEETQNPDEADALLIHEEYSLKTYNHINTILADPFLSKWLAKIYTINFDDSATGMFKGLYSQIPKYRLDKKLHASVAHSFYFINELVFENKQQHTDAKYLATWRGNFRSNKIRKEISDTLKTRHDCLIESTESWWNHGADEKKDYIDLVLKGKFSLCPAGWTPSTFRIFESMALGRCPVIIADAFAPPEGPDWNEFALFFPEKEIKHLYPFLKANEPKAEGMGKRAMQVFNAYFSNEKTAAVYAQKLLQLIQQAPKTTNSDEIKRWRSLSFQRGNKWTILQRLIGKLKRMASKIGG